MVKQYYYKVRTSVYVTYPHKELANFKFMSIAPHTAKSTQTSDIRHKSGGPQGLPHF